MQLAFAEVTPNPVLAERTRRKVEGWLLYEPWIKLQHDDGHVIERFQAYEKYVNLLDESLPAKREEDQEPTRDVELIELGIRPDQWEEYQKKLWESLEKNQEESNA